MPKRELKCSTNCKCGTKKAPCKNQVAEGQEIGNPSAFARHRQAVEDSQREIKVCLRGYKILFKLVYLPESCMQIISDSAHPPYCTHKLISLVCLSKARILKCKSFFFFGGT